MLTEPTRQPLDWDAQHLSASSAATGRFPVSHLQHLAILTACQHDMQVEGRTGSIQSFWQRRGRKRAAAAAAATAARKASTIARGASQALAATARPFLALNLSCMGFVFASIITA